VYQVSAAIQEAKAMLLDSNKQHEITKNRKTQQDRQNTQKRRAEKNTDQVGLQEAPH
jgi:siroheme synthase